MGEPMPQGQKKDSEMRLQNYQRYVLDTLAIMTGQKLRVWSEASRFDGVDRSLEPQESPKTHAVPMLQSVGD